MGGLQALLHEKEAQEDKEATIMETISGHHSQASSMQLRLLQHLLRQKMLNR